MSDILLEFPAPADPLSMNQPDNRHTGRQKQAWRDAAYWRWIEAHPATGPTGRRVPWPAVVHVTLPFPQYRRRDPINYARTVKAIVDGLTLAGAWPDDTAEHVDQRTPTLVVAHLPVLVRITPQEGKL